MRSLKLIKEILYSIAAIVFCIAIIFVVYQTKYIKYTNTKSLNYEKVEFIYDKR